ncbi:guanylate kinase [Williamsoniiplasma luminosum]|uniref:Guanylate kinase n=1 Tax=Williamsoniiplasma luminosum TaxID=214888 RepID=A0A2K8NTJ3_9MOLU|nr:guanylate kinase [Williamsoniiplasma luminosum]ATZ17074.1 guanylate kinase [Williamsoniiplasma luminosum]
MNKYQHKPRMIVVSGPSGVGKGSINTKLREDEHLNLAFSVSMTTRKPRNGEIDGVHYFFVTREQFEQAIANKELIEYAEFVGNYYGTPRKYVEDQIKNGKNVILEIEVDGATQAIKNEKNVLSIFLMPPTLEELASRLQGRQSEPLDVIKSRLDKAMLEVPLKHNYQYVVENDTVGNAVEKITDILEKEKAAICQNQTIYDQLKKLITKIVKEKYMFFVENWEVNIKTLKDKGLITTKEYKGFDAEDKLINTLTENVYHRNLAHGDFKDLLSEKYLINRVERLMFKINFFSIAQKYDD